MIETLWIGDLLRAAGDVFAPHGPALDKAASLSPTDFSIRFFLQLAIIIATCRAVGWLGQKLLGQPQVVGEMIAGVVLGPSLLGLLFPEFQQAVFHPETKNVLYAGAQFGVGLYMFLIGATLRLDHFRTKARSAVGVSIAGIATPFLMAAIITPFLMDIPGLFAEGLSTGAATLFLGACIALTAFPMLARIINERGLADTSLGTLSLTAGAFDDVASWCILAIVLAVFGAGAGVALLAIMGGVFYALFLYFFGQRLLAPLGRAVERAGSMSNTVLGITLTLFCLSAFLMDAAGLHAVFGGFLLGACLPRGLFVTELKRKIEPFAVIVLLPMFFTYSGLNTRFDMVNSLELLAIALGILAVSILAKLGACWAAARLAGEDNRTALGIGALMNARGLMELIIINIGLQHGIIGFELFSMMVLMAIITTMMAGPLFEFVYGRKARESGELEAIGGGGAPSAA